MGVYARYLLPRLTHLSMGQKQLLPYRQRVVTGAAGRVLEIGIGSGLNLPLYGDAVEEIIGIDISPELLATAERAAALASRRRLRVRLRRSSPAIPSRATCEEQDWLRSRLYALLELLDCKLEQFQPQLNAAEPRRYQLAGEVICPRP